MKIKNDINHPNPRHDPGLHVERMTARDRSQPSPTRLGKNGGSFGGLVYDSGYDESCVQERREP